jgi:hypothetical protein
MSEVLKLKVCIGNANIELEGEGNLVHTIFLELRENGLGKLSEHIATRPTTESQKEDLIAAPTSDESAQKVVTQQSNELSDLPNIDTIVIKNLPKTESEWILIYALFTSAQGSKLFTEDDLREMYHSSGRWNESRGKNFSKNLKNTVVADWITAINDSTYSLLATGKTKAYEILQRQAKSGISKKATNTPKSTYGIIELGLDESQRQDIKQYLQSFPSVSNMDRAVLIAHKLAQYGINDFNENTLFTVLRIADLPTSYDIKSSLTNGKLKKNYFISSETAGGYNLYHIGEDRAKALEQGVMNNG